MKKSKLSVGLVTSFIGALALTACGETPKVVKKDGVIVDFASYNNETDRIEVNTDMYDEIGHTSEGTKLFYDAILEQLIRYEYPKLCEDPDYKAVNIKSIVLLENEAADKVTAAKETAKENAKSSGKSVDEEWKAILESHDCETEEDLKLYYLYDLEKEELTDAYYRKNMNSLKDEYIGVTKEWKPLEETKRTENVDSVYPYHILHILVQLSADKADYVRGTISKSEATNLWGVVRNLIMGENNFQTIAMNKSEDTGSKDKFGDVEIMSTKTSFYNEFKLGIYAYDALLSGVNENVSDTKDIYNALGIGEDAEITVETTLEGAVKEPVVDVAVREMAQRVALPITYEEGDEIEETLIPAIPFDVFRKIGDLADKEKIGLMNPEAGEVDYPRNVIYNQFLNFHSPFVITDEDITSHGTISADGKTITGEKITVSHHDFVDGDWKLASTNFQEVELPGAVEGTTVTRNVLCDKEGNVIIGVRSEAGIHFMVMRKSIFENTNIEVGKEETSLQDYYTTYIPGEEGYPEGKQTFVNMIKTDDKSVYTNRVNTIKNEIKSTSTFDAAYDYRLYEELMTKVGNKIVFFDQVEDKSEVKSNIEEYIKLLRETKHYGDIDSINQAWQSYLIMLRNQNNVRAFENAMVQTTCAFSFNEENAAAYKEGGACYVNKK